MFVDGIQQSYQYPVKSRKGILWEALFSRCELEKASYSKMFTNFIAKCLHKLSADRSDIQSRSGSFSVSILHAIPGLVDASSETNSISESFRIPYWWCMSREFRGRLTHQNQGWKGHCNKDENSITSTVPFIITMMDKLLVQKSTL